MTTLLVANSPIYLYTLTKPIATIYLIHSLTINYSPFVFTLLYYIILYLLSKYIQEQTQCYLTLCLYYTFSNAQHHSKPPHRNWELVYTFVPVNKMWLVRWQASTKHTAILSHLALQWVLHPMSPMASQSIKVVIFFYQGLDQLL
jgi:hypothetical protein